jgi:simple sugar transport system ATP-binding protein
MIQRDLGSLNEAMSTTLGVTPPPGAEAVSTRQVSGSPGGVTGSGEASARRRGRPDGEAAQLDGLSVRDASGAMRLSDFTLIVNRGEIVGVAGVEGNGQTELGNAIAGLTRPSSGRVFAGGRDLTGKSPREITAAGVGVVPEDRHAVGCIADMTVAQNLFLNRLNRFARAGLMRERALREQAQELMQRFDVRAAGPDARFSSLSGGNQQKAVLARELTLDKLVFLLAAQPTRGLDVGAVESVFKLIRVACEHGAGVLLISSELDELIAVADRIVVLYRGRIMGERPAAAAHRDAIGAMMAGHAP